MAFSENSFQKKRSRGTTLTRVRMHWESNYIKAKESFRFEWSDFFPGESFIIHTEEKCTREYYK